MQRISVIIPTLDEGERIAGLLNWLRGLESEAEIIVADGGSRDRTVERAATTARVIHSRRGRAAQMNAAAEVASGDVLWFLHADCLPHPDSCRMMRQALGDSRVVGGAFEFRFDAPGVHFRVTETVSNLKNRLAGLVFGDMGIFVRTEIFHRLGGYRDLPLMEDMDFGRRLKRAGRIVILAPRISTSTRRWNDEGWMYNLVRNWCLQSAWSLGVSPAILARYYAFPAQRVMEWRSPK